MSEGRVEGVGSSVTGNKILQSALPKEQTVAVQESGTSENVWRENNAEGLNKVVVLHLLWPIPLVTSVGNRKCEIM